MDDLEEIAYHEAGHVVAGLRLGLRLLDTDLYPDSDGGRGHTNFAPPEPWFRARRGRLTAAETDFVERVLTTFMAGFAAESRHGHDDPDGSGYDRDQSIREWASYLDLPSLDGYLERAKDLVSEPENWRAIEAVARALMEKRRLDADAVRRIVD